MWHTAANQSPTNSEIFIFGVTKSHRPQFLNPRYWATPWVSPAPEPAMTSSLPGTRDVPNSQYDLSTYWGRVRHSIDLSDPR